jgi:hypothetical protein
MSLPPGTGYEGQHAINCPRPGYANDYLLGVFLTGGFFPPPLVLIRAK